MMGPAVQLGIMALGHVLELSANYMKNSHVMTEEEALAGLRQIQDALVIEDSLWEKMIEDMNDGTTS
jgi:hypothetical protein